MELLSWLQRRGSATTRDVAEFLGISRQAALQRLKTLERRGLIRRVGGSPGRGRSAVWIPVASHPPDILPLSIGMGLAWINSKESNGMWPLFGHKRNPVATALAAIVNAEILGRKVKVPIFKDMFLPMLGIQGSTPDARLEYYSMLLRALYLQRDPGLEKVLYGFDELLGSVVDETRDNEKLFSPLAASLYFSTPYRHLLSNEEAAVKIIRRDVAEIRIGERPILGLGWAGVSLLVRGYVKEAGRIARELLLRSTSSEEELYLTDRPPYYLEYIFGIERDSLDPTVLLYFLLRRLEMKGSEKALRHILKHQRPEGGFSVSPDVEPDVVRTAIVVDLLWNAYAGTKRPNGTATGMETGDK